MRPEVSILILTHNRLEAVRTTFEGLMGLPQTVEILVLDNASTDGTAQWLVENVQANSLTLSEVNLGVAGGRAKLMELARGEVILFLDSDVEVREAQWLERLLKALEPENVGAAGASGCYVVWTGNGVDYIPAMPGPCDVISGWCFAFKREVMPFIQMDLGYGRFWEEDSDLALQIRQAGWDVVCTGRIGLVHMPGHSGDEPGLMTRNRERLRQKWEGKGVIRLEGAYL